MNIVNNTKQKNSGKYIVHIRTGLVLKARFAKEPIDCFNLFISDAVKKEILTVCGALQKNSCPSCA